MKDMCQCENCSLRFNSLDDIIRVWDMNDFFERVNPGETMPYGECPKCGAVVHAIPEGECNRIDFDQLIAALAGMLQRVEYDEVTNTYNRIARHLGEPLVDNIWNDQTETDYWVEI